MNTTIKSSILAAAVAAAWGVAGTALAVPGVLFDVNGAAGPNSGVGPGADRTVVDSFDWGPGNTVAVDTIPTKGAAGANVLILSQANLSNLRFDSANTAIGVNGTAELTYQMSANALVTAGGAPGSLVWSNNDALAADTTFFRMFYDAGKDANAVTGCGFGTSQAVLPGCAAPAGEVLILEGTVRLVSMTWTPSGTPNTKLDTNGTDNQHGVTTIAATGSAAYEITVTFQDTNFFLSNITALSLTHDLDHTGTNGDGFIPGTTEPSDQVVGRVMEDNTNAATLAASLDASYGTGRVNGDPASCTAGLCDVHMVSDTSTGVLANVPEPTSVALLGLGLGLLAFGAKRRKV